MTTNATLPPLVVVEGFLGDPGLERWHHLISCRPINQPRQVINVHLGSLSSLHDRCCEIFYQIKGGTVDYGEQHSSEAGHSRYGRNYPGLYPEWDSKHPVHFLGHSMGGLTIWNLQQALAKQEFIGYKTNENWIRSVTGFSSPLRGTPITYILGYQEKQPAKVRKCSLGSVIYRICYLYAWLNSTFLKKHIYDLQVEHWQVWEHSWLKMIWGVLTGFQFDGGIDNAATDLTVERAEEFNLNATTFPNTYYRTYAATMTELDSNSQYQVVAVPEDNSHGMNVISSLIGRYSFTHPSFQLDSANWRQNDGVIPVISQSHPGDCKSEFCKHYQYNFDKEPSHYLDKSNKPNPFFSTIKPGMWHVTHLPTTGHFDVIRCSASVLPPHYKVILSEYWHWIYSVDETFSPPKLNILTSQALQVALTEARQINAVLSPLITSKQSSNLTIPIPKYEPCSPVKGVPEFVTTQMPTSPVPCT